LTFLSSLFSDRGSVVRPQLRSHGTYSPGFFIEDSQTAPNHPVRRKLSHADSLFLV
jgi:hypothetical protein